MTAALIVWPAFLGGRIARQVVQPPNPHPVYVCRPQRLAVGLAGRPAHQAPHPGAPKDEYGPAILTAWLHPVGAEQPDYAEIAWPDGRRTSIGADWVHPARNVAPLGRTADAGRPT